MGWRHVDGIGIGSSSCGSATRRPAPVGTWAGTGGGGGGRGAQDAVLGLPADDLRFIDFQFCAAITRNDHGYLNLLPPPNDTSLRLKSPIRSRPDTKPAKCAYQATPPAARAVGDARPERPAADVLREFVGLAVDEIVRGPTPETPRTQFPSVHDRWLHALRSATGVLGGPEADAVHLAEQVRIHQCGR